MKDRWKINKMGLINFWYYDFEEFELEDGKLLFRGANGSGKSVTMQSFIPLLLDGNRRPERLDPFGTNARKMENYLLMYEDEKERTAYLYMELVKPESQRYLTIGMGLKAVKGKGVEAWYFIIDDGRRVNQDINLFTDKGYEKVPLTKKELENRVGKGGFFTDSQTRYKEKVNEYLFGYSDIENYDELIDLLINIRTPKLSKDFKPTSMYEILENSLRQLTEDDLRPMSEAMENMDNIKLRIEQLEESMRAIKQIDTYYTRYNKYMLWDKAKGYQDRLNILKKLINEKRSLDENRDEAAVGITNLEEELEVLEKKLESAQTKINEYSGSDISRTTKRVEEIKTLIEEMTAKKQRLSEEQDDKKRKLNQSHVNLRKTQDEIEVLNIKGKDLLSDLEAFANECSFKNHEIFIEDMNFYFIKETIEKYRAKIREAKSIIYEYEGLQDRHEEVLKRKDDKASEVESLKSKLNEALEYSTTVKEEYIEKTRLWNGKNVELRVAEKELQEIARSVMAIEDFEGLSRIDQTVNELYNELKTDFQLKVQEENKIIENFNSEIEDINLKIENLKGKREAEFEKSDEVNQSRRILEVKGIPYIPLFKAIDFKDNVKEETRIKIESAMVDMGIIDALIIPSKYQESVREFDKEICDKFIFPKPNLFSYNLSEFLRVDMAEADGFTPQEIDDVLKSIQLDLSGTYIDEKGNYGLGILGGRANAKYELKYIGAASRKKHRERQIEQLIKEIELRKGSIKEIQNEINALRMRQDKLNQEYAYFPPLDDIREAIKLIEEIERKLGSQEELLSGIEVEYASVQESLKAVKVRVYGKFEGLSLDQTSRALEEAGDAAEDYSNTLMSLEGIMVKVNDAREREKLHRENIEGFEEDVDRLHGEISHLTSGLKKSETEKIALEETLKTMGFEEVQKEIEKCYRIQNNYPVEIRKKRDSVVSFKEKINNLLEKVEDLDGKINGEKKLLNVLSQIFLEEYNLKYVLELGDIEDHRELCSKALNYLEDMGNKSREDYDRELFDAFSKYNGALRDYQPTVTTIFRKDIIDEEFKENYQRAERKDIRFRIGGKTYIFNEIKVIVTKEIEENRILLSDKEKEFFQEILLKTISNKIRAKIYQSKTWVNKMNELMESMNTSSSFKLTLKWTEKKAENELQMDTRKLIEVFERDPELIRQEEIDSLSKHFSSKVKETSRDYEEKGEIKNYQSIIKDILDYRNWYEFKLYSKKEGEKEKELTNIAFYQLSGGEKAMAMYIPLFTAIYSRYDIADKKDCPRIAALDEAFAGVDEGNIRDMFRILKEMNLDFVLNSQVLWGDYDTVESLAICEIIRPENSDVVTVLRYFWNGKEKIVRI